MKYKVEIWCNDCTGTDPMGCFDGGSEFVDKEFESEEDAVEHGWNEIENVGPWEFRVYDENRNVVYSSSHWE
jgi:hypothetical protein